ncbi:MAG TPA: serine hydrolase [Blastocatellia bacterium]|nr:serine hydrolase [Blastocatellia bacterium]
MFPKRFSRLALALALMVANLTPSVAAVVAKQEAAKASVATSADADLAARLAVIEKKIDDKRKELGIPGASLVIVKDDKVIYLKGMGVKDYERKLPVTPDTLFAIGSSSKAFTAMSVMMSVDEGKVSLSDSPKKYLPYFKLQDAEADAKITVRDLLCHRSGLNRTDIGWYTGKLSREETIRVAGLAKPEAKFGEKFLYQNVMFVTAGEVVARAQNAPYEKVIAERIFKPLGMKASNLSAREMQKSPDYSLGYVYIKATNETRKLPTRDLTVAAAAGAINSNAREMAQWVRLMLGGGEFEGKRLVSEKSFGELVSKQMTIAGSVSYGLGWFLREWKGHKVVEHGGNIDGFNAQVALMPDEKLGFALLTNVTASPLGSFAMNTIWSGLVGTPDAMADNKETKGGMDAVDPKSEAGSYRLEQAGFNIKVAYEGDKLIANVPGQQPYTLINVGGRRYKLSDPAPDGFFITFRAVKDKAGETEMFLEQPQGNLVLPKLKDPEAAEAAVKAEKARAAGDYSGPVKELIGSYESEQLKARVEIGVRDGKAALIVPGQPAYPLSEKSKDTYSLGGLPDSYSMIVKRNDGGAVASITTKQPEGEFEFGRVNEAVTAPVIISVDELMAKVIEAAGGEANLRKHKSTVTTVTLDLVNQGVTGEGTIIAKAPNLSSQNITLVALGKKLGTIYEYFDGANGGTETSFSVPEPKAGKELDETRLAADFYEKLNWKSLYRTVKIKKMTRLGDEDAYVVEKIPEKGSAITDYFSARSFLLLKREGMHSSEASGISLPFAETFSNYRGVGGLMIPFRVVQNSPEMGDTVITVKDVKLDVELPDSEFRAKAKK